ncbi:MAG: hypothetical protein OXU66_05940 [Gammaproteobacteria bacterium]|nr:hypothetical protein [Gammaproteobacteria bacterium]MDD9895549.1 hypothetical protein [Gammaproteobacteria bacterium]MDD9958465.1 hypothetical protein [Gammaproteobacteria bacterium]
MKATFGVALILMMAVSTFALAQDEEQTEITEEESDRPIEQIDIVGERSLQSMRFQLRSAEESYYDMFNDLTEVDKYKIRCRTERRTSSHIRVRNCEPRFFIELRQDINRDALLQIRSAFGDEGMDPFALRRGIDRLEPDSEIRALLTQDYEGMRQEMFRIAQENEDYLNQLMHISELRAEYEAARQRRFGNNDDEDQ